MTDFEGFDNPRAHAEPFLDRNDSEILVLSPVLSSAEKDDRHEIIHDRFVAYYTNNVKHTTYKRDLRQEIYSDDPRRDNTTLIDKRIRARLYSTTGWGRGLREALYASGLVLQTGTVYPKSMDSLGRMQVRPETVSRSVYALYYDPQINEGKASEDGVKIVWQAAVYPQSDALPALAPVALGERQVQSAGSAESEFSFDDAISAATSQAIQDARARRRRRKY